VDQVGLTLTGIIYISVLPLNPRLEAVSLNPGEFGTPPLQLMLQWDGFSELTYEIRASDDLVTWQRIARAGEFSWTGPFNLDRSVFTGSFPRTTKPRTYCDPGFTFSGGMAILGRGNCNSLTDSGRSAQALPSASSGPPTSLACQQRGQRPQADR
jgi:hypothetical protein